MGKTTKILIGIILFLVIVVGIIGILLVSGDKILPNISIENIDVGRLTREEAEQKVKSAVESSLDSLQLTLKFQDRQWKLGYKEIGYSYDISKTIDDAHKIGRQGNFINRIVTVINSRYTEHKLALDFTYDDKAVREFVDKLGTGIDQEVVDATIKYEKPNFIVSEDKQGRILDRQKAVELIKQELDNRRSSSIELPVEIKEPAVKKEVLDNIKDVLGQFSTKFNSADVDRTHNIKIATSSASHVLLYPGEIYSVNKVVGPRLEEFGFKEAKVIINNELVPGIGGGVCQVSSTLYNAALLSNLKIIERRNHTLPLSYIAIGRDATISGDYIDLKFENSTPYPVYVYGEVSGSWVTFSIFGRNDYPERKVKIEVVTISTTEPVITVIEDPTLPEGTEIEEKKAFTGYVVKSYRVITENGSVIFKEPLFTDNYNVVDGVKRVGTMKVENDSTGGVPAIEPLQQNGSSAD
ncbi:MAG: VanW family protein [Bacillota bacterium]